MKKSMKQTMRMVVILTLLTIFSSVLMPPAARAQSAIVPAVVNVDKVVRESKAGKYLVAQIDKQKAGFKAELEKQRKVFREQEKKLLEDRANLSEEEFKKKVDELNKKGNSMEKALAEKEGQLETNFSKGRDQIFSAMELIVKDIAKERGLTLVLNRAVVLIYNAEYEITDEVMKKLDAKLPAVKLTQ